MRTVFNCRTEFACDICSYMYSSEDSRMTGCTSKQWFRYMLRQKGWKTIYGSYDVCPKCIEHYGIKAIRGLLIETAKRSDNNA